ncbi:hypothetical protein CDEST_00722 [Colletotrichum destructivum]|uniref:Uncharacterized protein n=1 Tax=Colletotrichum destructivum TaxID=34406 RepID=A0AAX4HX14_9PEZI|nr:hypothetical protein CDEST_00722 [Colletotrichum destructivum]
MSGPTRKRPTWSGRRVETRGDSADRIKIDLWRCVRPSSPRVGSTEAILEKTPCAETRGEGRIGVGVLYYMGVWRSKNETPFGFRGETRHSRWTRRFGERGETYFQDEGALSGPPPPLPAEVRHRPSLRTAIARLYYIGISTICLYNGGPPPHPDGVVHLSISSH